MYDVCFIPGFMLFWLLPRAVEAREAGACNLHPVHGWWNVICSLLNWNLYILELLKSDLSIVTSQVELIVLLVCHDRARNVYCCHTDHAQCIFIIVPHARNPTNPLVPISGIGFQWEHLGEEKKRRTFTLVPLIFEQVGKPELLPQSL